MKRKVKTQKTIFSEAQGRPLVASAWTFGSVSTSNANSSLIPCCNSSYTASSSVLAVVIPNFWSVCFCFPLICSYLSSKNKFTFMRMGKAIRKFKLLQNPRSWETIHHPINVDFCFCKAVRTRENQEKEKKWDQEKFLNQSYYQHILWNEKNLVSFPFKNVVGEMNCNPIDSRVFRLTIELSQKNVHTLRFKNNNIPKLLDFLQLRNLSIGSLYGYPFPLPHSLTHLSLGLTYSWNGIPNLPNLKNLTLKHFYQPKPKNYLGRDSFFENFRFPLLETLDIRYINETSTEYFNYPQTFSHSTLKFLNLQWSKVVRLSGIHWDLPQLEGLRLENVKFPEWKECLFPKIQILNLQCILDEDEMSGVEFNAFPSLKKLTLEFLLPSLGGKQKAINVFHGQIDTLHICVEKSTEKVKPFTVECLLTPQLKTLHLGEVEINQLKCFTNQPLEKVTVISSKGFPKFFVKKQTQSEIFENVRQKINRLW